MSDTADPARYRASLEAFLQRARTTYPPELRLAVGADTTWFVHESAQLRTGGIVLPLAEPGEMRRALEDELSAPDSVFSGGAE